MQKAEPKVELLVVGNELLSGTIQDTNSHWLSSRLTHLGFAVVRKTTIKDDVRVISSSFREILQRKPSWILSLGGLGPTYDDKTLQGLAQAVGKRLKLNTEAVGMVKARYKLRAQQTGRKLLPLTQASLKMATLPVSSLPLKNSQGTAPGVYMEVGKSKIVAMPGVPRELKAIFTEDIKPLLQKEFARAKRFEAWFRVDGVGESRLAPYLATLASKHSPLIYIKSHPIGIRRGLSVLEIQVIVSSISSSPLVLKSELERVTERLSNDCKRLGGRVTRY